MSEFCNSLLVYCDGLVYVLFGSLNLRIRQEIERFVVGHSKRLQSYWFPYRFHQCISIVCFSFFKIAANQL